MNEYIQVVEWYLHDEGRGDAKEHYPLISGKNISFLKMHDEVQMFNNSLHNKTSTYDQDELSQWLSDAKADYHNLTKDENQYEEPFTIAYIQQDGEFDLQYELYYSRSYKE